MQGRKSAFEITCWFRILIPLAMILLLIGCGSGSDGTVVDPGGDTSGDTGGLTYDGISTSLKNLYFGNWGFHENSYNIDILIAPPVSNYEKEIPEDGRYVYLEMFFETDAVSPGTYTWSRSEASGTFSEWSDIKLVKEGRISLDPLIGGTVTITIDGTNYFINGTVTTTRGPASFSYVGPLTDSW